MLNTFIHPHSTPEPDRVADAKREGRETRRTETGGRTERVSSSDRLVRPVLRNGHELDDHRGRTSLATMLRLCRCRPKHQLMKSGSGGAAGAGSLGGVLLSSK